MYAPLLLLLTVTFLYAGYNLLIKVSSNYVPAETTSTILATITLQVAALTISCIFAVGLLIRGASTLTLTTPALLWAAAAGLCIGTAEIGYFYLFRGSLGSAPVNANLAIPVIVGGTILVTIVVSWLLLREPMTWMKFFGAILIVIGVVMMFLNKDVLNA